MDNKIIVISNVKYHYYLYKVKTIYYVWMNVKMIQV